MSRLVFVWVNVLQTALRLLPFRCRTGLIEIGDPGPDSPVLLTCNFRLTVERVKRALEGIDAHLLVANSRGVNVWCAATGGLLTNHDVVSVLKTSGIESRVDHRRVILPQLAATGIEGKVVRERTGWSVVWGPVYSKDIPAYLGGGLRKTVPMRTLSFPWPHRVEMAVAWAFPLSLLALLLFPFWREAVLPLVGLIWGLSLLIFLTFPLYQSRLDPGIKHLGFVVFDFGRRAVPLFLWLLFLGGVIGYGAISGELSWGLALRWGLPSLVVILVLSLDLTGSTPVYKSALHAERLLRITLDAQRCRGAGLCEQVCPRGVFQVDRNRHQAALPHVDRCVRCGACIVQCPCDALHFRSPGGSVVTPDTVRRFKLNLLGDRLAGSEHE